jgi:glycosyltransferase involved in cell wall biosynthesis
LVVGDLSASVYRVQHTVEVLTENLRYGPFRLAFFTPRFGQSELPGGIFAKLVRKGQRALLELFNWSEFIRKAVTADIIYVLPMSAQELRRLWLLRPFLHAKVVADFFVDLGDSYYDRLVRARASRRKFAYLKWIDRLTVEVPDLVIALSRADFKRAAATAGAAAPKRLEIIPYGVPARQVARPTTSSEFRLCWWGEVAPLQGLDHLLEGIRLAVQTQPNIRLSLFCKPEPAPRVANLREHVSALGLSPIVQLHTDVTFANGLEAILAEQCDLVLGSFGTQSTRASTSMGQKIAEALSMRLPVLTRSCEMLREFVDEDHELFTCEPAPAAIAESLVRLARNAELRDARAGAGLERWKRTFSDTAFRTDLRRILKTLLDQHVSSAGPTAQGGPAGQAVLR